MKLFMWRMWRGDGGDGGSVFVVATSAATARELVLEKFRAQYELLFSLDADDEARLRNATRFLEREPFVAAPGNVVFHFGN